MIKCYWNIIAWKKILKEVLIWNQPKRDSDRSLVRRGGEIRKGIRLQIESDYEAQEKWHGYE